MPRYFCSLDTRDTLDRRLVVNMSTRVNIEQAIAENICPEMSHAERVEQAKKGSSDYIDTLWFRLYNPGVEFTINIETGDIIFSDGTKFVCGAKYTDMCNHEIHRNMCDIKQSLSKMRWYKHMGVHLAQNKWRVNDVDSNPQRFKRSRINTHITHTCVHMGMLMFATFSRKCRYTIGCGYPESVWRNWIGANVTQSDDNKRDHLKHVV